MLDFIYIFLIAVSAFTGLMLHNSSSPSSNKLLILFLFVTAFNEIVCYFLKRDGIRTFILYNIYYYFRFPIIGLIYYRLLPNDQFSKIFIKSFFGLSVVLLLVCLYLYNGFSKLHTLYLLTGGTFTIAVCLLYLLGLLKSEEVTNPFKAPYFWISTGLLFFFLGVLPYLGIINFLVKNELIFASQPLIIAKLLSIQLYSFITIDFYIQWKEWKSRY